MMAGGFVLVVGPSGAGKDTLIDLARTALDGDTRFVFARRIVTRASSIWEQHDSIDMAAFTRGAAAGAFVLSWQAHGLGYAIPATMGHAAAAGKIVICNVSRGVVDHARRTLPGVTAVSITAPAAILAQRVAGRGRAADGPIAHRLARVVTGCLMPDLVICNDGRPEDAAAHLIGHLRGRLGG